MPATDTYDRVRAKSQTQRNLGLDRDFEDPSELHEARNKVEEIKEKYTEQISDILNSFVEEAKANGVDTARIGIQDLWSPSGRNPLEREKLISKVEDDIMGYRMDRAGHYDELAEQQETWAGVLHDNPPSEEFLKKYGKSEQYTVLELAALDQSVQDKEEISIGLAERIDKALQSPLVMREGTNERDTLIRIISRAWEDVGNPKQGIYYSLEPEYAVEGAFKWDDDERYQEWQRLWGDSNTTVGQLNEIYATAVRKIVRGTLDYYKIDKAFLEDISSGRAAQWE
ncbi:MAG: hypothetical protein WAW80_05410 [Candidatus Saccharimonadales bacterium]